MNLKEIQQTAQQLNAVYEPLEEKARQLRLALDRRIFEPQLAYYSGHYRKDADGVYNRDFFPIPVVEVKGFCDVEINLDCVSVTTKLRRDSALTYPYEKLAAYEWEAYGVNDYTSDFYLPGMAAADLKENIRQSREQEISFTFRFDFGTDANEIYEFIKLLRREGFYY